MCGTIPIVESWHHTYRTLIESKINYKYFLYNSFNIFYDNEIINYNYNIFEKYHLILFPNDFNILFYKILNKDLSHMNNEDLIYHYIIHGNKENRIYKYNLPDGFDISLYKLLNNDLSHMSDEDALKHYIKYGKDEKRKFK